MATTLDAATVRALAVNAWSKQTPAGTATRPESPDHGQPADACWRSRMTFSSALG